MSKRARNDGPEPRAIFPAGSTTEPPLDVVEPGKYLSGDVPQKVHEEVGRMDGWSLVEYTAPGSKKKEDD